MGRLAAGEAALQECRWAVARAHLEEFARTSPDGAGRARAYEGLAWAAWWLNETDLVFDARREAFALYRRLGDDRDAGRVAIWAAVDYLEFRGEESIAAGWFERAARLLAEQPDCEEQGWLALHQGALALEGGDDTRAARRSAERAADLANRTGSVDVRTVAMAIEGLARVSEGDVPAGMRLLEESNAAGIAGELTPIARGWCCCYLIYACERVHDYGRASQWCEQIGRLAQELGVRWWFGVGGAHYGAVLVWRGDWSAGEDELRRATEVLRATHPPIAAESLVRLAELRRRQGRLKEAADLFVESEPHALARLGLAEIALEAGDHLAARQSAERLLRSIPAAAITQRFAPLDVLVRAQAVAGDVEAAVVDLASLDQLATRIGTVPLRAATAFARGCVTTAQRDFDAARRSFEDSVDLYDATGMPYEGAQARLRLADVLDELNRRDESVAVRARAGAALAKLVGVHRAGSVGALTARECQVLSLVATGLNDREIAARLRLSGHTVHRHVSNILTKLRVPSRTAAVAYAQRHGLI